MKAVVQRVLAARVRVEGEIVGEIGRGALVLVGALVGDGVGEAQSLAKRVGHMRYFADEHGRMNLAIDQVGGALLVVSQFTLAAGGRGGRRPSFDQALEPDRARELYEVFIAALEGMGVRCERGCFGAHMVVEMEGDGPVTLLVET